MRPRHRPVAYLGGIDTRHLGTPPDDKLERASIQARIWFSEAADPKLEVLVNRAGGDDAVKRLRMAVHAPIPWPLQPERARLGVLDAQHAADGWYRLYQDPPKMIEAAERHDSH
jgi:hypothetical protein